MRFVVVEIPDNEEADQFVAAVERGDVLFGFEKDNGDGTGEYGYKGLAGARVPQVYAVPTMFCECDKTHPEGRSKKYGWYVCTSCSRPRKGSMQHPFNLLERDKPATERAYYMGFRADRRGWRIPKEHP